MALVSEQRFTEHLFDASRMLSVLFWVAKLCSETKIGLPVFNLTHVHCGNSKNFLSPQQNNILQSNDRLATLLLQAGEGEWNKAHI